MWERVARTVGIEPIVLLAAIAAEVLGRGSPPGASLSSDSPPLGYSVAEAARLLRVSDDLVRAEISRGTLVARHLGRRLVIPAAEVARLLKIGRQDEQP